MVLVNPCFFFDAGYSKKRQADQMQAKFRDGRVIDGIAADEFDAAPSVRPARYPSRVHDLGAV